MSTVQLDTTSQAPPTGPQRPELASKSSSRAAKDIVARVVMWAAFFIAVIPLVWILGSTLLKGFEVVSESTWWTNSQAGITPRRVGGGAAHAIQGTLYMALVTAVMSVPIGVFTAIYLVEYGRGRLARLVSFMVDILTGIPSIVAALFIYALWVSTIGLQRVPFAGAAMVPLATAALATAGAIFRVPLAVVLLFCLGCVAVLTLGPQIGRLPLIARSSRLEGICHRVGGNAARTRATFNAGGFLVGCWSTRALGNTLLLWALGVGFSPTFALVILCMAAAASILPITAGGAIVGVGATSGVLLALGVPTREAVNYAVASGLLLTCSALVAAMIGVCGSILFARGGHLVRAEPA